MKIEIKKIGNSDGLILPRELMQRLDLKRGQQLHITEMAGGGFQVLPYDRDFEKTMEIAKLIANNHTGAVMGVKALMLKQKTMSQLEQFDAETIYTRDSPGVVDITVREPAPQQDPLSPFVPPSGGTATAEGSGFVYDEQGDIITADHVVSGGTSVTVRFPDGRVAAAKVVGTDASTDLAVIRVDVPADALTPLALGDSSAVRPGQALVAIGSPYGYAQSITAGIASAVDRGISAPNGFTIPNAIQTDAAINHGNSGGPLIEASGAVVGVNDQIQSTSNDNSGVGFAVPSNTVRAVAADLIAGRKAEHSYLGIRIADRRNGAGAMVESVQAGSPAAKAGLRAGDLVTEVDGAAVADANALTARIASHRPGDKVVLVVFRDGKRLTVSTTLVVRPAATSA